MPVPPSSGPAFRNWGAIASTRFTPVSPDAFTLSLPLPPVTVKSPPAEVASASGSVTMLVPFASVIASTEVTPARFVAVTVPAAAQNVIRVGGPGGQFSDIRAAIQAAAPGDVVLVEPGTYPSFGLDRGITIVALGPVTLTTPVHYPTINFLSIAAGPRAVIAGPFGGQFGILVVNINGCVGHVHFEGATSSSVFIDRSASVTLRNVIAGNVTATSSNGTGDFSRRRISTSSIA